MPNPAKYIHQTLCKSFQEVYTFASNPANLPQWAEGLSNGISKVGDNWIAQSPMGEIVIKFAPPNPYGILDHEVILPAGTIFYNPMRVFANGDNCEVVFTLFHLPQMSEVEFLQDAQQIEKDLLKLKSILEN